MKINISDRNNPLYIQVKKWILERIENGDFQIGAKIPTELELESILGVSRGTIREAFRELIDEGYVIRIPGKGTYIKSREKNTWSIETLISVADAYDQQKIYYTTKIINIKEENADNEISLNLKLGHNPKVIRLDRIRSISSKPVHLSTSFLPFGLGFPLLNIDLENKSLYKIMDEMLGIKVVRVERIVQSKIADKWETKYLQLPSISAILVLTGIAYNPLGIPVESSVARFSSENCKFEIQSKKITEFDIVN